VFFFFQAEDGIRDRNVTGVQTCALPISSEHGLGHLMNPTDPDETRRGPSGAPKWIEEVWRGLVLAHRGQQSSQSPSWFVRPAVRSEERRVGKEWRSRWSADH